MKQAIMYGAGNIGRGFIGQLFSLSGYEVSFIDVNIQVIDRLNAEREYPVYVTRGDSYERQPVLPQGSSLRPKAMLPRSRLPKR